MEEIKLQVLDPMPVVGLFVDLLRQVEFAKQSSHRVSGGLIEGQRGGEYIPQLCASCQSR